MNKVIILSGATATGKTSTSLSLAKFIKEELHLDTAIVNFDSLLFYKELTIGTAKPNALERSLVNHFLIDCESIYSPANASLYIQKAIDVITTLHQKNIIPILVGGSGFYLRALMKGMYNSESPSDAIKSQVDHLYKTKGINAIVDYLSIHDEKSLQNLHINDHYRLMRAMIHHLSTGTQISKQKTALDQQSPYDFSSIIHPWQCLHFYLDLNKEEHFNIIMQRTTEMLEVGLIEEIVSILDHGASEELKPLQSIGYKETIAYLKGQIKTKEDLIERISISTRQLAKSQRTFFKKITPKITLHYHHDLKKMQEHLRNFLTF